MLLLLNMLVEYCQCVDDTPMLVTDIMNKLFETLKVRFQVLRTLKVIIFFVQSVSFYRLDDLFLQCFIDVQLENLSVGSRSRSSSTCWIKDHHSKTSRYLVVNNIPNNWDILRSESLAHTVWRSK